MLIKYFLPLIVAIVFVPMFWTEIPRQVVTVLWAMTALLVAVTLRMENLGVAWGDLFAGQVAGDVLLNLELFGGVSAAVAGGIGFWLFTKPAPDAKRKKVIFQEAHGHGGCESNRCSGPRWSNPGPPSASAGANERKRDRDNPTRSGYGGRVMSRLLTCP